MNCARLTWNKRRRAELRAAGQIRRGSVRGVCLVCGRDFIGQRNKRFCGTKCARRSYARTHRGQRREASRRYRERHPDRVREQLRKRNHRSPAKIRWRKENRDRLRDYERNYRAKHREQAREKTRRWRQRNVDRVCAQARLWRKLNPERHAFLSAKRRARVMGASGSHTEAEWRALLSAYGFRCAYCGVDGKLTRDHIVPLIRGGSNDISNIVPACPRCNALKGRATAEEFLARLALSIA